MVPTAPGVGGGAGVERRGSTSVWMGCPEVKVRKVERASPKHLFGAKNLDY